MDEDLAALSWTLRDEADQPWFGVLLITSAGEGMWADHAAWFGNERWPVVQYGGTP